MPDNRTIAICIALSFLTHLVIMTLAALVPWTSRTAESVMVVELADLPRAADFLPPKPGILQGGRPKTARPPRLSRVMEGRVPDLPVNPALPPEEKFPIPRAKEAPTGATREAPMKSAPPVPVEPVASGSGGKPTDVKKRSP